MPIRGIKTRELLLCISQHLSTRPECKGLIYHVTIDDTGVFVFDPDICVYPNSHRRKISDKIAISAHVLKDHFPDLYLGTDEFGRLKVSTARVVPGNYTYQAPYMCQRRRWARFQ